MGGFLRRWLVTFIAVFVAAYLLRNWLTYTDLTALVVFALILAMLNAILRPLLIVLTLPLSVLTLGLFVLIVNAIVFWLAAAIVPGIYVRDFFGAFLAAIVVSIVSYFANRVFD
ncbi:MAG: phage holin family protein [Chloroflexi bacterium]|nr:phage holin family protein [Chloroflexota bacterium]MDA8188810.1 phage holin family protein [Dehalococcoidales bacterium]